METFGKYQVVERIGEGGFGQVFKGWDPQLKRHVAIKTVSLSAPMARERFMREAEIAASLHHPAIVTIFDFGEQDGVPYLVQEFLTGEDLAERIARGATGDMATRITWLMQAAEGLRFAHARGVVHRDIKPSNVRVLEDGSVRLMDFGIAKVLDSAQQLTGTHQSVGTSGFVSPEQLEGKDIDHRADIFSFGVMAYELVTGQRPFSAPSVPATLYRILTEEPVAAASLAPDCPPRLDACIARCLRKQREERFADCTELLAELRASLQQATTPASAPAPPAAFTAASEPHAVSATGALPRLPSPAATAAAPATAAERSGAVAGEGVVRRQKLVVLAALVAVLALAGWALAALVGVLGGGRTAGRDSTETTAGGVRTDSTGAAGPGATVSFGGDTASHNLADAATAKGPAATAPFAQEGPRAGNAAGTGNAAPDPGRRAAGAAGARGAAAAGTRSDARQAGDAAQRTGSAGAGGEAAQIDPARVLVLVRGPRADAVASAQQTVIAELMARSRPIVDPDAIDELRADAAAMRALAAGASPAAGVGREYGAGIVVVADLMTDAASTVAGFITGTAVLTARVYNAATGALLFTEKYQVGAGGVPGKAGATETDAITQAAEAVARQLARSILEKTG